jgi:prepilin-type N-terminal cleavage/methylation domain-containing protein
MSPTPQTPCQRRSGRRPARTAVRAGETGRRGFTLIEILLVTAILAVLIAVLGACIGGGLRVWDSARVVGKVEGQALLGLRLLERDLMNAQVFDGIQFAGRSRDVSFAALIRSETAPGAAGAGGTLSPAARNDSLADWRLGTVTYVFDGTAHAMLRSGAAYGVAFPGRPPEKVVQYLHDIRFEYGTPGLAGNGGGQWQSEWSARTNLPDCVRAHLTFVEGDAPPVTISRTIVLPGAARLGGDGS